MIKFLINCRDMIKSVLYNLLLSTENIYDIVQRRLRVLLKSKHIKQ